MPNDVIIMDELGTLPTMADYFAGTPLNQGSKMENNWKNFLSTSKTSAQICKACGRKISRDLYRFRESWSVQAVSRSVTICPLCLLKMADFIKESQPEQVQKWKERIILEAI